MSVRSRKEEPNEFYFCTFTCTEWLELFRITNSYDLVYKWFDICQSLNYRVCGYVIMPSRLHCILFTPDSKVDLSKLIGNGKRFMAYEMVKRLEVMHRKDLLQLLSQAVTARDKKRGKLYQVFKESFDGKELYNERLVWQKLDYMHHNPVSGKWNLASDFVSYEHSSAKYYETGAHVIYRITDFREVIAP